jgi:hypothetical protein
VAKHNMTVTSHTPYSPDLAPHDFSVSLIKLKVCHFETTDMIEAEFHAVLNTFTKHNFQDAFSVCFVLYSTAVNESKHTISNVAVRLDN